MNYADSNSKCVLTLSKPLKLLVTIHAPRSRMPVGVGQLACGIKDGDGAAFVAVAALVVAVGRPERCRGGRDLLDLLVQGRLVVLDPDDQGYVGFCCDGEIFFGNAARRA